MKKRVSLGAFWRFTLLLHGLAAEQPCDSMSGNEAVRHLYSPLDRDYHLTAEQIAFVRPGLVLELRGVTIPEDLHPVVEFSIRDPAGLPLDFDGVCTPGPVSVDFIVSRTPQGETQQVIYNTRTRTGPDGVPVVQADRDRTFRGGGGEATRH